MNVNSPDQTLLTRKVLYFIRHDISDLNITVPMSAAAVCREGSVRRACKNMAAHKCEQVPVVGGCVYSGRGVKDTLLICPPGLAGCQTVEGSEQETLRLKISLELMLLFHLL